MVRRGRRSQRGRARNNNQIVTVAQDGDVVGARFDRMVSNMRNSESAIPVLVKTAVSIASGNAGGGLFDFGMVANSDEFIDLAKQYRLFKIKAIRFEVFHQVASFAQPILMSTYHDLYGISDLTVANVLDGEDAKYMDAGAGKQTFYWLARGLPENEYQSVGSFTSYGGLRWHRETNAVNPNLIQVSVVITAQVVFKGRT